MSNHLRIVVLAVVSLLAAVPIGGFLFGFEHCVDCGDRLSERFFLGCIFAVLTILGMGTPGWRIDPNGPPPDTAWPQISLVAGALFALALYREYFFERRAIDRGGPRSES